MALTAASAARADDVKVMEILSRLKNDAAALRKEFQAAPASSSLEVRLEAFHRLQAKLAELGRRALALPDAESEVPEALIWIHAELGAAYPDSADVLDAAYDRLAERHLGSPAILPVCWLAGRNALNSRHAAAFLRAVAERSPLPELRGVAWFGVGRSMQDLARVARALGDPATREIIERNLGPERCGRVRSRTAAEYRRDAELSYEQIVKGYADQACPNPALPPLGKQAEGALFRLRHLEVGCTLPDVEGVDLDGKPIKLSDYRGKVVVLTFWAAWCGPCLGLVPSEKELVERMKGRPFALLGVNGDEDPAEARAMMAKEGINWRSFSDGGPSGPIATKWNVVKWPTIYVLDAGGTIRDDGILYFEYFHNKSLAEGLDPLVKEAEAERP